MLLCLPDCEKNKTKLRGIVIRETCMQTDSFVAVEPLSHQCNNIFINSRTHLNNYTHVLLILAD